MRKTTVGLALGLAVIVPATAVAVSAVGTDSPAGTVGVDDGATIQPVAAGPRFGTKAYSKKYARAYMKRHYGWGRDQYRALLKLWSYESEWDHKSENPTSGAYGIPQSLPADKMKSAGVDWKHNPETQIRWGLSYIKSTYGSPAAAWQHETANNWY